MLILTIIIFWLIGLMCTIAFVSIAKDADNRTEEAFRRRLLVKELSGKRIPHED